MKIKTLAEILAESDTDSAGFAASKKQRKTTNTQTAKPSTTERFNKRQAKQAQRLNTETEIDTHKDKKSESKAKAQTKSDSSNPFKDSSVEHSSDTANSYSERSKSGRRKKRKKRFHPAANFVPESNDAPAYQPPEAQSIQQMLAEVKRSVHGAATHQDSESESINSSNELLNTASTSPVDKSAIQSEADNLPSALKAYLRTPEQKQAQIDAIKAESRLRWLAFYYLSRREYGKAELKQKLIDKEQDPDKIDALLDEFAEKGYQSDYRTTLMLIRENIRKGRGRERIKQEFYKKKIAMPSNLDELIDMANAESEEFSEFVADEDDLVTGVDWLRLAVEARTKKYGDDIPTEQKEKAKQLRFLQYRGFKSEVCFAALNYTTETLDERF